MKHHVKLGLVALSFILVSSPIIAEDAKFSTVKRPVIGCVKKETSVSAEVQVIKNDTDNIVKILQNPNTETNEICMLLNPEEKNVIQIRDIEDQPLGDSGMTMRSVRFTLIFNKGENVSSKNWHLWGSYLFGGEVPDRQFYKPL